MGKRLTGHIQTFISRGLVILVMAAVALLGACAPKPMYPYSEETAALVLLPPSQAGIHDGRGRFREIFCTVLEERGQSLPDYRPCEEALVRVGREPMGTGEAVELGPASRKLTALLVPGVGWDCFADWLDMDDSIPAHLRRFGYELITINVEGLSSTARNARHIRDAIMEMGPTNSGPDLVLVGYSKGAPDILEALVTYPEIHGRIAAMVSIAGAVGGSPLANDASQSQLALMRFWPEARCDEGDGGAVESLRPSVRKSWLAENSLPASLPYFSLVTYPKPEKISSVLTPSYQQLSQIDARNDSQLLFYDQVIPHSTLLGFANADHWALAVPIARTHSTIGSVLVDQNRYPREAMFEALLRFIEEQLAMLPR
ncbi:MAG: lipase family alpha/beta hydrolase [Desulfuromonadales bacterium]